MTDSPSDSMLLLYDSQLSIEVLLIQTDQARYLNLSISSCWFPGRNFMEPNFWYKEKTDLTSLGEKRKKGGERALLIDWITLVACCSNGSIRLYTVILRPDSAFLKRIDFTDLSKWPKSHWWEKSVQLLISSRKQQHSHLRKEINLFWF